MGNKLYKNFPSRIPTIHNIIVSLLVALAFNFEMGSLKSLWIFQIAQTHNKLFNIDMNSHHYVLSLIGLMNVFYFIDYLAPIYKYLYVNITIMLWLNRIAPHTRKIKLLCLDKRKFQNLLILWFRMIAFG